MTFAFVLSLCLEKYILIILRLKNQKVVLKVILFRYFGNDTLMTLVGGFQYVIPE